MRRVSLVFVLLALAAPAGAEAACPDRDGYRVAQRSGDVVVTSRARVEDGLGITTYRACHRRVGRDPVLIELHAADDGGERLERLLFAGRFVAAFSVYEDKYQDRSVTVAVADVRGGRRLGPPVQTLEGGYRSPPYAIREAVLAPTGHVAWIDGDEHGRSLMALIDGHLARIASSGPPEPRHPSGVELDGGLLRWTVDGQPREYRLREVVADPAVLVHRTPRRLVARLRDSRRPPFPVARDRAPWFVARTLIAGERLAVIEQRSETREHSSVTGWRVTVWDARRRRPVAPPVFVPLPLPENSGLGDATLRADGVLALSVAGYDSSGGMLGRLVVVSRGAAHVVAEQPRGFDALRLDPRAVAWVEDGERTAPLPPS